ncbi:MAG TPA: HAD-IIA family hydrolase [Dermatophilaceae bacterium]|nr:HAD-IIA family hydrolase [Dermatophilaceae bacterium]
MDSAAKSPVNGIARSTVALIDAYDGVVCDLDGVVYRGHQVVPHAVESLLSALSAGVLVVYATNNASRTPSEVSDQLDELGLPGTGARIVTSAQAAARLVAQRCPAGSMVLGVGGPGVALALEEAGLLPVSPQRIRSEEPVVAVVQGYGANVGWADLAEVAYAVQAGAFWVATNIDSTLPTDRGLAPGNGALVAAVRSAVSVDPVNVGKPNAPLYELSASVLGTDIGRTLAIGDRLDTDIVGAAAVGMDSLFVLGGVHGWADVAGAEPAARPRYVATDLRSLHSAYAEAVQDATDPSRWICGAASARVSRAGELVVARGGAVNERLRAALRAGWDARDLRGVTIDALAGDGAALSRELDLAVGLER